MNDNLTLLIRSVVADEHQWLLMFFSAFLSSTILPGNSELVFSTLISASLAQQGTSHALVLLLSATMGNSLGSFTTYLMGRLFPPPTLAVSSKRIKWALHYSQQYGVWILLLSWLPVIGDLLCGVAGWLRLNPWQSLLLIILGKAARYVLIWWGVVTFVG